MKLILKLYVILVDCQSELGNYLYYSKLIESQLYNEMNFNGFIINNINEIIIMILIIIILFKTSALMT